MFPISSAKFSEDLPTHILKLLEVIVVYCEKKQWEDALTLSTIALKELDNGFENKSRDVGLILFIVGCINTKVNKYDDAEILWKRAISILNKEIENNHYTVEIIHEVVDFLATNGKLEEAEFFGRKTIEILEKFHQIDESEVSEVKIRIGLVWFELQKPDEAKKLLWAVMPGSIGKFGIDSVQVKKILELLEAAYFWRNNIEESRESFKNANEIVDAYSLESLGIGCEESGLLSHKAIHYYEHALKIYESSGLQDSSTVANIKLKLGRCYFRMNNRSVSQRYLKAGRAFYKQTLADDDPMILEIDIHSAYCYIPSQIIDKATAAYEEILRNVDIDVSGVPFSKLAEQNEKGKIPIPKWKSNIIDCALNKLSALYVLNGKYEAAKSLQELRESKHDLIEDDTV